VFVGLAGYYILWLGRFMQQSPIASGGQGLLQQGRNAIVPASLCELERRRSASVRYDGISASFYQRANRLSVAKPAIT